MEYNFIKSQYTILLLCAMPFYGRATRLHIVHFHLTQKSYSQVKKLSTSLKTAYVITSLCYLHGKEPIPSCEILRITFGKWNGIFPKSLTHFVSSNRKLYVNLCFIDQHGSMCYSLIYAYQIHNLCIQLFPCYSPFVAGCNLVLCTWILLQAYILNQPIPDRLN